jgi:hypothetical protein
MEVPSFDEFADFIQLENFEEQNDSLLSQNTQPPVAEGSIIDILLLQHEVNAASPQLKENTIINNSVKAEASKMKFQALLKPAKSRDDQYETSFPPTMLCTPYKYDLKFVGEQLEKDLSLSTVTCELVDSETDSKPELAGSDGRPGVILESVETQGKDKIFRFALNWCSFHFKKRSFRLKLFYRGELLFASTSFHTYARRRDTPYTASRYMQPTTAGNISFPHSCRREQIKYALPALTTSTSSYATPPAMMPAYEAPGYRLPWFGPCATVGATSSPPSSAPVSPKSSRQQTPSPPTTPPTNPTTEPKLVQTPQRYSTALPSPPSSPQPGSKKNGAELLASFKRTQMAIQLLSTLSPQERDAVQYYLSCFSGR